MQSSGLIDFPVPIRQLCEVFAEKFSGLQQRLAAACSGEERHAILMEIAAADASHQENLLRLLQGR